MKKAEKLAARITALADDIASGTQAFMRQYEEAGNGISRRMSGEAAALIVETRCTIEGAIRELLKP
jgi:thymidine phosphorylase